MGDDAFSLPQRVAMDVFPQLQPMFRGWAIDKAVRDAVADDSVLGSRLSGVINRGVDFTDSETKATYEVTTQAQFPAKITKYGPDVGLIGTDNYKNTPDDSINVEPMDPSPLNPRNRPELAPLGRYPGNTPTPAGMGGIGGFQGEGDPPR